MSAEEAARRLYGEVGVRQGIFSADALRRVRQAAPGQHPGEALMAEGVISRGQHKGLLRAVEYRQGRDEDKRIAQILVDNRYCDGGQVREALAKQKQIYAKTGKLVRLALMLMEGGSLTASQQTAARKLYELGKRNR